MELVDTRLQLDPNNIAEQIEAQRVLKTAILCVQISPERRPTMFRVLAMLAGDADADAPESVDPNMWMEFQSLASGSKDRSSSTRTVSNTFATRITNGNATAELSEVHCR